MAINTLHKVTLTEGQIGVILCSLEKSVKYATNKYLTENIDEYDEYAYEVLEDYVTDTVGSYEIYQEFLSDRNSTWERD